MATNAEFPPFEFVTEKGLLGEYDGIDVAIAMEVASKLGKELEISNMVFDSIIPSVVSGKADIGVAGMTVTEDRLKNIDFTDPYTTATQVIIVRKK
jgi:polar amino acid transport system substrate-binding protein